MMRHPPPAVLTRSYALGSQGSRLTVGFLNQESLGKPSGGARAW